MNTDDAMSVAREYHDAWTANDYERAGSLLADRLAVEVPINEYPTKASFAQALADFGSIVRHVELLSEMAADGEAMLLYDLDADGLGKMRVAEHFTVEGGKITRLRQIHDTAAVRAAGLASPPPITTEQAARAIATARAAADLAAKFILATVEVAATPDRVFAALTSADVIDWWVRPGVFDTRTWDGNATPGGHWRTSGVGPRGPYELTGEYLQVDPPRRLVHTWEDPEAPGATSKVSYDLSTIDSGTRITLRQEGEFASPVVCANIAIGWETSFGQLAQMLATQTAPD
jgi:uncharacterized protein YndB with AHSA1/START domain/limonene-1,2-epoxide hydrolase